MPSASSRFMVPTGGGIPAADDGDDGIVDSGDDFVIGMDYHRYSGERDSDDDEPNHPPGLDDDGSSEDDELLPCGGPGCGKARESCGKFATLQARLLGPLSPERAPGSWMVLNAFCGSWSLSLGVYLTLLYLEYGNETAASRATTTDYLVWSLLTTLVWVVEICLRAAFPGLETVVVVATASSSEDDEDDEEEPPSNHPILRSSTTAESVVTLETVVQKRSTKHKAVIVTELVLAAFFAVETVSDCWNHWQSRHHGASSADDPYDSYYDYDDGDEATVVPYRYSMLQQQSDIWINVLAYAYMTYETYHEYYKSKTTRRDLQRSLSSTLLYFHHQQQQQQQQQQLQQQQQQQQLQQQRPPSSFRHPLRALEPPRPIFRPRDASLPPLSPAAVRKLAKPPPPKLRETSVSSQVTVPVSNCRQTLAPPQGASATAPSPVQDLPSEEPPESHTAPDDDTTSSCVESCCLPP